MIRVLFICHGNICRSPMGEYVLQHLVKERHIADQFEIASAATSREEIGNDVHYGTKRKLKEVGIDCPRRAARQMTKADYEYYDYIIAMDRWNLRNMTRFVGDDPYQKVSLMMDYTDRSGDVADPWYTGDFEATYRDVMEGCLGFLKFLGFEK